MYAHTHTHTCIHVIRASMSELPEERIHTYTYRHTCIHIIRASMSVLLEELRACYTGHMTSVRTCYIYIYTCIYVRICYIYIYTCIYYYIYIYIHIYILYYIILYVLNIIRRRACRTQWAPEVTSFFRAMAPLLRPFLAGCTR